MHPLPGHRLGLRAPPATAGTGRKPVAAVRRGPVPGLQCLYRFGSAAHARWLQDRVRQRRLTPLSWSDESEDPIPGLRTLRDAADHIQKLPKAQQKLPHWQTVVEALIMAASRSPAHRPGTGESTLAGKVKQRVPLNPLGSA
jgi:hypothetical protein